MLTLKKIIFCAITEVEQTSSACLLLGGESLGIAGGWHQLQYCSVRLELDQEIERTGRLLLGSSVN